MSSDSVNLPACWNGGLVFKVKVEQVMEPIATGIGQGKSLGLDSKVMSQEFQCMIWKKHKTGKLR